MPLYEVAILEHPKVDKDNETEELEKLVFGPKTVIAATEQLAAVSAVMDNAEELKEINRARMEILVRPFA